MISTQLLSANTHKSIKRKLGYYRWWPYIIAGFIITCSIRYSIITGVTDIGSFFSDARPNNISYIIAITAVTTISISVYRTVSRGFVIAITPVDGNGTVFQLTTPKIPEQLLDFSQTVIRKKWNNNCSFFLNKGERIGTGRETMYILKDKNSGRKFFLVPEFFEDVEYVTSLMKQFASLNTQAL